MLFRGNVRNNRARRLPRLSTHRRHSFDLLEERRLLAGIDVLVFQDVNQSGDVDAANEAGASGRVLFLDSNLNGSHDALEPVAISNSDGVASFRNLRPGRYAVSLLGQSIVSDQTTPVLPAVQGEWASIPSTADWPPDAIVKPVLVQSDGLIGYVGSELIARTSSAGGRFDRLPLEGAISEVWVDESATGAAKSLEHATGLLKVQREVDGRLEGQWHRFSWDLETGFEAVALSIVAGAESFDVASSVRFGDRWVGFSPSSGRLVSISVENETLSSSPLSLAVSGVVQEMKSVGRDGFLVREQLENAQRLSQYRVIDGELELVAERSFRETIEDWSVSSNGELVFAQVSGAFLVLDTISGMPTITSLSDAQFPIAEDALRGVLYTSTAGRSSLWNRWNRETWELETQFELPAEVPGDSVALVSTGDSLVSLSGRGFYERRVNQPSVTVVELADDDLVSIAIGVRQTNSQEGFFLDGAWDWSLAEDESVAIDLSDLLARVQSLPGTVSRDLYWVVTREPELGELAWSVTSGGVYSPYPDRSGSDRFWVAAYDGQRLSNEVMVRIDVAPRNDPPQEILLMAESISVSTSPGEAVAEIRVVDPDRDDAYDFAVSDSRFAIIGTALHFIQGRLDIESEAFIPLLVTAIARNSTSERLSRWLTLRVSELNDAPVGLLFRGALEIPERTQGVVLGDVSVVQDGLGGQYEWSVSDSRFEIVANKLGLKPQIQLDYELEPFVGLTIAVRDNLSGLVATKSLLFRVLDLDDPAITISAASEYHVEENRSGDLLGYVYVRDADRNEQYSIAVSDDRFEIVENAFRLKARHALQWVEPGHIDLTLTATSLASGYQVSKGVRVIIDRDQTPYHNDSNPGDVDGDGIVSPLDPLIIVNHINSHGPGVIRPEGEGPTPHMDVDGDGVVSPLDILVLINIINSGSANPPSSSGGGNDSGSGVHESVPPDVTIPTSKGPGYHGNGGTGSGEGEGGLPSSDWGWDWDFIERERHGRRAPSRF
jgi:hypothetical protein